MCSIGLPTLVCARTYHFGNINSDTNPYTMGQITVFNFLNFWLGQKILERTKCDFLPIQEGENITFPIWEGRKPSPSRRRLFGWSRGTVRLRRDETRLPTTLECGLTGGRFPLAQAGSAELLSLPPAHWSGELGRSPVWLAREPVVTSALLCSNHHRNLAIEGEIWQVVFEKVLYYGNFYCTIFSFKQPLRNQIID